MSENSQIPTSTQWTRDAVESEGREAVDAVYRIGSPSTESQGTGFLLDNGYIITNEHVIRNAMAGGIMATSAHNQEVYFSDKIVDRDRDLAVLEPTEDLTGGLELKPKADLKVGQQVSTWGYPLGHSGPSPLLSVGYLSGFNSEITDTGTQVKQLVVNGAFNDGNSGGPLFLSNENTVIGVVVAKHAPFTEAQKRALRQLGRMGGIEYEFDTPDGETETVTPMGLTAELLRHFIRLTQVMIGYAVDAQELAVFLDKNGLPT